MDREEWFIIGALLTPFSFAGAVTILAYWSSDPQFLKSVSLVTSSLFSLLLVSLYYRQHSLQQEQAKTQKAQFRPFVTLVSKPEIYWSKSGYPNENLVVSVRNSGNGLARNFKVSCTLDFSNARNFPGKSPNIEGRTTTRSLVSEGGQSTILQPDSQESFYTKMWLEVSKGGEKFRLPFQIMMAALAEEEGVVSPIVHYKIRYQDIFEDKSDTFGNDYEITHRVTYNTDEFQLSSDTDGLS